MVRKAEVLIFVCFLIAQTKSQPKCPTQNTCTHPKVAEHVDLKWYKDAAPPDGWHMEIGNKVARLHIAELIQGKTLTYDDDYSKMCGRIRLDHADEATEGIDGHYYGFEDQKVDIKCHHSETEKGVFECDYSNSGLSKYDENRVANYVTYSDNENVFVVVKCFPNGESGWVSASKTKSLTKEERNQVLNHVKAIGLDINDVVPLYDEKCK